MKKVIGIISIVLFVLVSFQSCAAGIGNALEKSKVSSGSAGFLLAVCMLIAGIIAIISKTSKGMTITSIVFYAIGGLVGICNIGIFKDLQIWSILSFIFAALLIFHIVKYKDYYNKVENK